MLLGWSAYAGRINHIFYDLFSRQCGARTAGENIVIVAIDDATLTRYGALPLDRSSLAGDIQKIQQARPRLVAVDLLLADRSTSEADSDLEQALAGSAPAVLATALEAGSRGRWLRPLPEFAEKAAVRGHTHADPGSDGVNRQVLLAKQGGRQRYRALPP